MVHSVIVMNYPVGCCDAENISTESGTTYIWPDRLGGEVATFTCPLSPNFSVNRSCSIGGVWQSFNEEGCGVVNEKLNRLENMFTNVRLYTYRMFCCVEYIDISLI